MVETAGKGRRYERMCLTCGLERLCTPSQVRCPHDHTVLVGVESTKRLGDAPLLGEVVRDRYAVTDLLGAGGQGAVYRAWDTTLHVSIALKVLRSHEPTGQLRQRFLREARILARLRSPHVVRVSDFGELLDGTQYMVMDWVRGQPMTEFVRVEGGPDVARCLRLMDGVFAALADVHAAGLVHRDLKPANIIVSPRSDGDHVTLLDFGIAKGNVDVHGDEQSLTATQMTLGTPRYMAPEQFMGRGEVTARSDIYAAGVMLYEIIAGRPPFSGGAIEVASAHLRDEPPPLPDTVPPPLAELVRDAMRKVPDERIADVETLRRRLAELLPLVTPIRGTPPPATSGDVAHPLSDLGVASTTLDQPARRAWLSGAAIVVCSAALVIWLGAPGGEAPVVAVDDMVADASRIIVNVGAASRAEPAVLDASAPIDMRVGVDSAPVEDAERGAADAASPAEHPPKRRRASKRVEEAPPRVERAPAQRESPGPAVADASAPGEEAGRDTFERLEARGLIAMGRGDRDLAIVVFEKATSLYPKEKMPFQRLCATYKAMGNLRAALPNCRRWLELEDDEYARGVIKRSVEQLESMQ